MVDIKELYFKYNSNKEKFTISTHDYVNRFVQKIVGKHDEYSEYSVSPLQCGKIDENGLIQYPNGGVIGFRTANNIIFQNVVNYFQNCQQVLTIKDMELVGVYLRYIILEESNDLLIQRLALKDKAKDVLVTFKQFNDINEFIYLLTQDCKSKLTHYVKTNELSEEQIESIVIKPIKPEYWSTSQVKIHQLYGKKQSFTTSNIKIRLEGDNTAQLILIKNGFGKSTGYGCGYAKQNNTTENIKEIINL